MNTWVRRVLLLLAIAAPYLSCWVFIETYVLPERLASQVVNLTGSWKIQEGDAPGWREPAFDDSGWKEIHFPGGYHAQGFQAPQAWGRRHFELPAALEGQPLLFTLGGLRTGRALLFLNGHEVGRTDDDIRGLKGDADGLEAWRVDSRDVRPGANVLAIRFEWALPGDDGVADARIFLGAFEQLMPYYVRTSGTRSFFQAGALVLFVFMLVLLGTFLRRESDREHRALQAATFVQVAAAAAYLAVYSGVIQVAPSYLPVAFATLATAVVCVAWAFLEFCEQYCLGRATRFREVHRVLCGGTALMLLGACATDRTQWLPRIYEFFALYLFGIVLYVLTLVLRSVRRKRRAADLVMASAISCLAVTGFVDLLTDLNVLQAPRLFSLAIIDLGLCAGAVLIADFVKLSYVNQQLSARLTRANSELEVALAGAEEAARLKNELLTLDLLQRFEHNFRALTERSPEAVIIRQQGQVVYVNPAGLRLLGYAEPSRVLGTEWSAVLHPDDRAAAQVPAAPEVEEAGPPKPREQRLLRADGAAVFVELTELALEFNGLPSTVVLARDITERRQLQARLLLADRLASVGTLATGIAHEINNPMSYVTANLALLSTELAELARWNGDAKKARCDVAELSQVSSEALEGAQRVNKIVKELKLFARGDDERLALVDLHAVVRNSLSIALHELKHRARVVLELEAVPPVLASESKLGQVCLNLLVNAGQALPVGQVDQHRILVRTRRREDGWALLEVLDTGCGISPENQRRLFDPFFTTKPVGVGTGLGLSICHGIIQKLGGAIEVESEVGQGSLFRIALPPHRVSSDAHPIPQ